MPKVQEYFENNFSINRETIEFNGWNKPEKEKLEGSLDLKEFKKLKKLIIPYNKITSLNLTNCPDLETLDMGDNLLTSIDLSNNHKLKWISFYKCPIKQELTETFSHLTSLERLSIDETPFNGSLRAFSKSKLKRLDIRSCPNIERDWEFLPHSLSDILNNNSVLFNALKNYQNNFPAWRKDHDFLINRISKLEQQLIEQEKITKKVLNEKEQLEKQLENEKQTFLTTAENLNNYVSQLEEQLANLQANKQETKIEILPK